VSTLVPLLDTVYPDEWHSLPDDDIKKHELNGACWCKPEREILECEDHPLQFMWYHNAADGRHHYADGDVPLQ
jgi:hypothetical protein